MPGRGCLEVQESASDRHRGVQGADVPVDLGHDACAEPHVVQDLRGGTGVAVDRERAVLQNGICEIED